MLCAILNGFRGGRNQDQSPEVVGTVQHLRPARFAQNVVVHTLDDHALWLRLVWTVVGSAALLSVCAISSVVQPRHALESQHAVPVLRRHPLHPAAQL